MQTLMVVAIAVTAWIVVLTVVVAFCKAAQAGDRAEAPAAPSRREPARVRPAQPRTTRAKAPSAAGSGAGVASPAHWPS